MLDETEMVEVVEGMTESLLSLLRGHDEGGIEAVKVKLAGIEKYAVAAATLRAERLALQPGKS